MASVFLQAHVSVAVPLLFPSIYDSTQPYKLDPNFLASVYLSAFSLFWLLLHLLLIGDSKVTSPDLFMTPAYHTSIPPSAFVEEINAAQYTPDPSSASSSSSTLVGTFINTADQSLDGYHRRELRRPRLQYQDDKVIPPQGLRDQTDAEIHGFDMFQSKEETADDQERRDDQGSLKWLPSKIRILRRMMRSNVPHQGNDVAAGNYSAQESDNQKIKRFSSSSSADQSDHSSSSKGSSSCISSTDHITVIRVCSDCNTTKTPLWRSGPRGPKSLCNACGIRQRKARRAMAAEAAAAAANGETILLPADAASSIKMKVKSKAKSKRSKNGACNIHPPAPISSPTTQNNDLRYEDFSSRILSSKLYSAYQRVLPQDEREAAILLMALSCGLVHG
ncbi:hypothetical protein SAY86_025523 [Trapa natans]|uniref:GATA-type domain-containing protein n=1 Tax=Trapa natans TaxID=22666 RepID=A0AAN7M0T8_TRANT|nr:hypothetical protein SAY86_025523 [Trapa natans]